MTLLDTNVLIYASDAGTDHHSWAGDIITHAVDSAGAGLNPVSLAELCVGVEAPDPMVLRDWELLKALNQLGSRSRGADPAPAAADPALASLVDDWVGGIDAVEVGRGAGMRRPVSWPEILLLPSRTPGR